MKISYAITVCNEFLEIQRLVNFLLKHKRMQDNIVILYDEVNGDWVLSKHDNEIGRVKIQQKKAIIYIPTNELTLTLNIGKEKENKQNLEIIKSL